MPTLDDVYWKFGFAAEAAQLLETELGTALMMAEAVDKNLLAKDDQRLAAEIFGRIDRMTLGQITSALRGKILATPEQIEELESLLSDALGARNRLQHSFFREHNFRRNSEEGRAIMFADLESIHATLLDAYKKALKLLNGLDLDDQDARSEELPTRHLPMKITRES